MKDERKFKEVIHTIKGAEKDKDKFCKAARIEREPMSKEKTRNDSELHRRISRHDTYFCVFLYTVLFMQIGGAFMADTLDITIPAEEREEIQSLVSLWLLLPKEDRAVLLSNANAFRVRRDIERARA